MCLCNSDENIYPFENAKIYTTLKSEIAKINTTLKSEIA